MLDYIDYAIDGDGYQGDGDGYHHNGYDQLDGDYALFYKVAQGFTHRVKREDSEDFLHDLLLTFARVKLNYDAKGKELTTGGLVRIACYEVAGYWSKYYRQINGIDCGSCSQKQRAKCKEKDLYRECPKALKLDSLNRVIGDGNGNEIELHELIADDKAVDLVARLEARLTLKGYPKRFVQIAYKRYAGYPLTNSEQNYFWREGKKAQKRLVLV